MENFVWRPRAKIVAIVDILAILFSTCLVIFLLYLFRFELFESRGVTVKSDSEFHFNISLEEEERGYFPSVTSGIFWITCVVAVVTILIIGLQLWAAVKLLRAGTIGENPKDALRMAFFWRNVTTVLLIISLAGNLIRFNITGFAITAMWRGISLYIVGEFTEELENFLQSQAGCLNPLPDNVIIIKK